MSALEHGNDQLSHLLFDFEGNFVGVDHTEETEEADETVSVEDNAVDPQPTLQPTPREYIDLTGDDSVPDQRPQPSSPALQHPAPVLPQAVDVALEQNAPDLGNHPVLGINGCLYRCKSPRRRKIVFRAVERENGLIEPDVESFFGEYRNTIQAHVILDYDKKPSHFLVAGWTGDATYPRNAYLAGIRPRIVWNGDIVVFTYGQKVLFKGHAMGQKELVERAVGVFISQVANALDAGGIPAKVMFG